MTESLTILAVPGIVGSVIATAQNQTALTVVPQPQVIRVTLRNLVVTAVPGIGFANGVGVSGNGGLALEGSLVHGFGGSGVSASGGQVRIVESIIRDNGFGLFIQDGAPRPS